MTVLGMVLQTITVICLELEFIPYFHKTCILFLAGNKLVVVSLCRFLYGITYSGVSASHITHFFLGFLPTKKILYVSNHIHVE